LQLDETGRAPRPGHPRRDPAGAGVVHLDQGGGRCQAPARPLSPDRLGQLLETFVLQELRRQASWSDTGVTFFHYRDKDQVEVDLVLEAGPKLAGLVR